MLTVKWVLLVHVATRAETLYCFWNGEKYIYLTEGA